MIDARQPTFTFQNICWYWAWQGRLLTAGCVARLPSNMSDEDEGFSSREDVSARKLEKRRKKEKKKEKKDRRKHDKKHKKLEKKRRKMEHFWNDDQPPVTVPVVTVPVSFVFLHTYGPCTLTVHGSATYAALKILAGASCGIEASRLSFVYYQGVGQPQVTITPPTNPNTFTLNDMKFLPAGGSVSVAITGAPAGAATLLSCNAPASSAAHDRSIRSTAASHTEEPGKVRICDV